jgi:ACS family hexuronate transporter-like MFS transporter
MQRRVVWTVAVIAAFTMTVSYVDRQTLAVLAPTVTAALGLTETQYGWLQSAFNVAYLVAVPLAGWWIERVGARRGLAVSVLVWSCVAALHALAPGFAVLFALRIALGVAEGPSFPGAALTMYRVLPASDRARGYSLLFTGSSIGSMVAPLLVTWLLAAGWQIAFLGTAAFGLCWLPLWLLATRRADVRAAMAGRGGGGARSVEIWAALRRPATVRALIAVLAVAPTVGFGLAWSAKYLVAAFAVSKNDVGYYLWLPPLALDLGAIGFGDLLARYRAPRRLACVAVVLAGSLALLPLTTGPWQAAVVLAIALAGGGAMNTMITGDLLGVTAGEKVSTTAAVLTAGQSIALIAANPLMGWAADRTGNHDASAIGCAIWLVPGVAAWLVWRLGASA